MYPATPPPPAWSWPHLLWPFRASWPCRPPPGQWLPVEGKQRQGPGPLLRRINSAAPGDVSAVVNNPAAMSTLDGVYFKADVTLINFSTKFSGGARTPPGTADRRQRRRRRPDPARAGGVLRHAGGRGQPHRRAVTVPFGFTTEYNKDWVGRYKAVKSHLQTLDFTVSYSYAINNQLLARWQPDRAAYQGRPHQHGRLRHVPGRPQQ